MKAIVGGRIFTGSTGEIGEGAVLMDGGKIVAVGSDVAVPEHAEVIDAAGKCVTPGLVDAHTHIGLASFSETTSPYTPQVRILDSIDLTDPGFEDALQSGVTSVIITPGSSDVICGTSIAMKTAGSGVAPRILRDPAGMKMAWRKGTQRPSQGMPFPMSRMGIAGIIRDALTATQDYMEKRELDLVPLDPGQEALAMALRREIPVLA